MTRLAAAALCTLAVAGGLVSAQQTGGINNQPIVALQVTDVVLAADRMRADRWYPEHTTISDSQAETGRHNRATDMDILMLAARHPDPQLRGIAVRELGRFETPANIPFIATFLEDPVLGIRRIAADALVQSTLDRADTDALPAVSALEHRLTRELQSRERGYLWEALAELPMPETLASRLEREWVDEIEFTRSLRLDAADALLKMARRDGSRRMSTRTETAVVTWAEAGLMQGDVNVRSGNDIRGRTLTFLKIAHAIRADDEQVPLSAARFQCRTNLGCGADIRLFCVEHLNPSNASHLAVLESVATIKTEPAVQAAALRKLADAPDAPICRLLDLAAGSQAEPEVIAKLKESEGSTAVCGDWDPRAALWPHAQRLASTPQGTAWIVPMEAMETLARWGDTSDALKDLVRNVAAFHPRWPVRAAAARAATRLKDTDTLARLLETQQPVVRAEAIRGLFELQSPLRWALALDQLEYPDAHLTITLVELLDGAPDRATTREVMFASLMKLTVEARDTSRRARLSLIGGLSRVMPGPQDHDVGIWLGRLNPLLRDFDPKVADAAARLAAQMSGVTTPATPTRRPAHQPDRGQLTTLPPCITLSIDQGKVSADLTVVLDRVSAPLAAAHLVQMVNGNQLAGLLFHQVSDAIAVSGNRSGHNEGGIARFIRDEVRGHGRHVAYWGRIDGADRAVLVETQGGADAPYFVLLGHDRDELDGRFAIRTRDSPAGLRRETVLGRVIGPARDLIQWTTITRAWIGAPESIRRVYCTSPPGIPSILGPGSGTP